MLDLQPALLIGAVAAVGVLHTMVPDHWLPISLYARGAGWSRRQTATAAAGAGLGHALSTMLLGLVLWFAGTLTAQRFGHLASRISSAALIAFGLWICIASLRELRHPSDHEHAYRTQRLTLMLVLGSSPMLEGLPAFFAAGQYGAPLLAVMAAVFGVTTIATYVVLCVGSLAGLQMLRLGALERYGEVLSGGVVALLGAFFFFMPAL